MFRLQLRAADNRFRAAPNLLLVNTKPSVDRRRWHFDIGLWTLRLGLLAFSCLLFATLTCGQTTCTVKLADLPDSQELRGFHLGMSRDQAKARVPQITFGPTDDFGVSKTTVNPDFDPRIDKSALTGIRSISLDFLDARLTSLWFGFDSSFKWKTVDEFVKGISASLHLPPAWQPWKIRGQQLKCVDFLMSVNIIAEGPSFRIVDQSAENTIAERREAKEAQDSEESGDTQPGESEAGVTGDAQSKIYYTAACPPAKEIPQKNRVTFKNSEEAEQAGFTRSKNCKVSKL